MPEYPLHDVSIHGFRGLKHLRLDGLGQINVLVGPNNCGKTSVLEALSILCNAFEPYEWVSMVRRRDFGRLDETRIQSLRWCFPQSGLLADPDASFQGECTMTCNGLLPFLRRLRVTYKDIVGHPDPQESERRRRGLVSEGKEEEEEEIDDAAPLAPQPRAGRAEAEEEIPSGPMGGLRPPISEDGEILGASDDDEPVEVADEDVEDDGYQLEDEDEETSEEEEDDDAPMTPMDEEF